VIHAVKGELLLSEGVVLSALFKVADLSSTHLRTAVRLFSNTAPFQTFVGFTSLAEGIPIGMTMIFTKRGLAQLSFRFARDGGVDENLVHAEHEQWLVRTLGSAPYNYHWGAILAMLHPRDAQASVSITWRGMSHLHDSTLPPARCV
jgi:hypothetical protein